MIKTFVVYIDTGEINCVLNDQSEVDSIWFFDNEMYLVDTEAVFGDTLNCYENYKWENGAFVELPPYTGE